MLKMNNREQGWLSPLSIYGNAGDNHVKV
jgi:hypothetical protein